MLKNNIKLASDILSNMKDFSLIVSATKTSMGIGKDGVLPWKLKSDMEYFKSMTTTCRTEKQNAVIMGRKTWESIPVKFRPLSNRVNVVLSKDNALRENILIPDNVFVCNSLQNALSLMYLNETVDEIYIIGGGTIYKEAIELSSCTKIYFTEILSVPPDGIDTFFPKIPISFIRSEESDIILDNNIEYRFVLYKRRNLFCGA